MKHTYRLLLLSLVLVLSSLSSCEIYNPAEPVPGYIHIEKIDVTTTSTQGTNSSKIADAWIYIDDQLLGCFELPVTVPVIAEGTRTVKVRAGIKVNGIASNRAPYPFYAPYTQQVNFESGKRITLSPTVTYYPTANFNIIDFELPGVFIDSTHASHSSFQVINSPPANIFEGSGAGLGSTNPATGKTFFEAATVNHYVLPKLGAPVFLEFNYKCNTEFTVSIIAWGTVSVLQSPVLHFNPSSGWNKTYTYLTPNVSSTASATDYQIVFGMVNSTPDSTYLLLDNIKLVH